MIEQKKILELYEYLCKIFLSLYFGVYWFLVTRALDYQLYVYDITTRASLFSPHYMFPQWSVFYIKKPELLLLSFINEHEFNLKSADPYARSKVRRFFQESVAVFPRALALEKRS